MSTPSTRREWRAADVFLVAVLGAVALYGLAMVLLGPWVGQMFGALGFGAAGAGVPGGEATEYVYLLQSVIGAVLVGWMVMALVLAIGPVRRRERWAWRTLLGSISAWFVLDTGYSLAVGQNAHALFNVAFAAVLGAALVAVRPARA